MLFVTIIISSSFVVIVIIVMMSIVTTTSTLRRALGRTSPRAGRRTGCEIRPGLSHVLKLMLGASNFCGPYPEPLVPEK